MSMERSNPNAKTATPERIINIICPLSAPIIKVSNVLIATKKNFADKGVEMVYFSYTQDTSSAKLREALGAIAKAEEKNK